MSTFLGRQKNGVHVVATAALCDVSAMAALCDGQANRTHTELIRLGAVRAAPNKVSDLLLTSLMGMTISHD